MTIQALWANKAVNGTLNTIMGAIKLLQSDSKRLASFSTDNSLIGLTHSARVEPLCILSQDVVHLEYITDVMQTMASLVAGYYLQGVAMTAQVNGVAISRFLDRLNPNRKADAMSAAMSIIDSANKGNDRVGGSIEPHAQRQASADWRLNMMAYEWRLPTTKNTRAMAFEAMAIENMPVGQSQYDRHADARELRENQAHAMNMSERAHRMKLEQERRDAEKVAADAKAKEDAAPKGVNAGVVIDGTAGIKSIREITDLSVGKMLNVTVGGGKSADGKDIRPFSVPVSIRLMANSIPDSSLLNLLASGSMDNSLKERYHAWRSGRIEFIRDLIFCQDLIDEYRKAVQADRTGLHSEILRRVNNAKLAGLADREPSLNVASNLYVISEAVAAGLEKRLGGSLHSASIRNKIFDSGYAMIICVIDRHWERVTFYHRGMESFTSCSIKDIKAGSGKSGPDIGDILKAYQLGSAPAL